MVIFISIFFAALTAFGAETSHLDISAQFFPQQHMMSAQAEVRLTRPVKTFVFSLQKDLAIQHINGALREISSDSSNKTYQVDFAKEQSEVSLSYQGVVTPHEVDGEAEEGISPDGIALIGNLYWHPMWNEDFSFTANLTVPSDWKVLTPGEPSTGNMWGYQSHSPIDFIPLVAYAFHSYSVSTPAGILVNVWLRSADPALAQSFLDQIPNYLAEFSQKIGPFPFTQYTVVENYWETGFAFPGFTLLGPSVIRLPFIFTSSLPHEILHSWWGNSAYVDYHNGNWCEGLTTFMADHQMKIREGMGAEYRRKTLQGFQDFISSDNDFPVRQFTSRLDRGTQAIGYGKTMMIFNMLEHLLGQATFKQGLRDFYRDYQYQSTSFTELQKSFEGTAGRSLESFWGPWLDQLGAPLLGMSDVKTSSNPFQIKFTLSQSHQQKQNYVLPVPVQITFADNSTQNFLVTLDGASQEFSLSLDKQAVEIWADPNFDVFRSLYREESPLALSKAFGEKHSVTIVYPAEQAERWSSWTTELTKLFTVPVQVIKDSDPLPTSGVVIILGDHNAYLAEAMPAFTKHQLSFKGTEIKYGNGVWDSTDSVLFATEAQGPRTWLMVWNDGLAASDLHARKIGHYASFSIVGFRSGKNQLKEEWPVLDSPLRKKL